MPQVSQVLYDFTFNTFGLSFDGEKIEILASSTCDHEYSFGLANYRNLVLTTGSAKNSSCYNRTELYNFTTNQWSDTSDYNLIPLVIAL